ncbi:MAG: trypsin-like peptidase domain-containing protein, partial [Chloroflexales bacterium]|nr:trypsin-like peptidase domain-containing protein [Chloroflexales bacterium]
MATRQPIAHQQTLLKTAREHLAVLLKQHLSFGVYAPPYIVTEIARYRAEIARIKQVLRDAGVPVDDDPSDSAADAAVDPDAGSLNSAPSSPPVVRVERAVANPHAHHGGAPNIASSPATPRGSSREVSKSVVRITSSANAENTAFGTGFVVAYDAATGVALVVTCAHVVQSVAPAPLIWDLQAMVVAIGKSDQIDLAVLRVVGLSNITPLQMQHFDRENQAVTIPGWARYGKQPRLLELKARLDRPTFTDGL